MSIRLFDVRKQIEDNRKKAQMEIGMTSFMRTMNVKTRCELRFVSSDGNVGEMGLSCHRSSVSYSSWSRKEVVQ